MPVRVEVGPRDLAEGNVTLVTRHRRTKDLVPLTGAVGAVGAVLAGVADDLRAEAGATRQARTVDVDDLEAAAAAGATGFARLPWSAVGPEGEARLAADGAQRPLPPASRRRTGRGGRRRRLAGGGGRAGPTEGGPSAAPGS